MRAAEERFTALARELGPRVLAYAARRTRASEDAADVLNETLLVAWRRFDDLPAEPEDALPWLLGVARRVLANQRRSRARAGLLAERLRAHVAAAVPAPDAAELEVREALAALPEKDRELLALVAWEGLSARGAARVLGIREAAARKRLQRGRERLERLLADGPVDASLTRGMARNGARAVPSLEPD